MPRLARITASVAPRREGEAQTGSKPGTDQQPGSWPENGNGSGTAAGNPASDNASGQQRAWLSVRAQHSDH